MHTLVMLVLLLERDGRRRCLQVCGHSRLARCLVQVQVHTLVVLVLLLERDGRRRGRIQLLHASTPVDTVMLDIGMPDRLRLGQS